MLRVADRPHAGLSTVYAPDPAAALVAHRGWLAQHEAVPIDNLDAAGAAAHRVAASRYDPPSRAWRIRNHLKMVGVPAAFALPLVAYLGWGDELQEFNQVVLLLIAISMMGQPVPGHPTGRPPSLDFGVMYFLLLVAFQGWLFDARPLPLALATAFTLGLACASARYSAEKDLRWSRRTSGLRLAGAWTPTGP